MKLERERKDNVISDLLKDICYSSLKKLDERTTLPAI